MVTFSLGSGTTGVAALHEGFNFLGIEIEPSYNAIARARLQTAVLPTALTEQPDQELSDA